MGLHNPDGIGRISPFFVGAGLPKRDTMAIERYRKTISDFPIREQGEVSKIVTWEKFKDLDFRNFINENDTNGNLSFSRKEIFELCKKDALHGLFASVIWGYPGGMRGDNFEKFLKGIKDIQKHISYKNTISFADLEDLKKIKGVGISTLSKFLYFFDCKYEENGSRYKCFIFDQVMNDICGGNVFSEDFQHMKNKTGRMLKNYLDNFPVHYPNYLKSMDEISKKLSIHPGGGDKVEGFLFLVGRGLKP